MGINLGTAAQCHFKTNQVAFAKAEIETGFYSKGTGKIVISIKFLRFLTLTGPMSQSRRFIFLLLLRNNTDILWNLA